MIKNIAIVNLILTFCICALFLIFLNQNVAISCLVTSILLIINLVGLYIFWRIVFFKKSIALGLLIIIFKYPLIAFCLWQMSRQSWVQPVGILASMLLFLASITGVVIYNHKKVNV